jgi:hypothetical protein
MRRYGPRLVLTLALIAALGTTAVAAPAATASTSSATTRAKVTAAGISVAYPKGWTTVPASAVALNDMIKALEKKNPKAAAALETATKGGLSKQVKLYAIDLSGTNTRENLNVIALGPTPMPSSVAQFESTIAAQYSSFNATVDHVSAVKVSGSTAYRADISVPLKLDDGTTVVLHVGQLVVETPKGVAVATVTAGDNADGSHTVDTVLGSVAIL